MGARDNYWYPVMYNHFIRTFIDAQTAARRHYGAIASREKRLFGDTSDRAVRVPSDADIVDELRRVYETLATRIIEKACTQFGRDSAALFADRTTMFKEAGLDIDRSLSLGEVPDFDRLNALLEACLGNKSAPAESEA